MNWATLDHQGLQGQEAMIHDFEIDMSVLEGCEVLLASYNQECYEGSAFVLYRKDGKLYEVNGSHCSCFGLEGQWEPEETSIDALRKREWGYVLAGCEDELNKLLDSLKEI
jgi:hypothetical protein